MRGEVSVNLNFSTKLLRHLRRHWHREPTGSDLEDVRLYACISKQQERTKMKILDRLVSVSRYLKVDARRGQLEL